MSQINLQGPTQILQPRVGPVYQEANITLPTPVVGIGYTGINLMQVGEVAAKIGLDYITGEQQRQFETKATGLEALSKQTARSIKEATEINDMAAADAHRTNFGKQAEELLGFNPIDPDAQTQGRANAKLMATARAAVADIDEMVFSAKRGWTDTIRIDNYQKYREAEDRKILESNDPIAATDEAIVNLKKMYGDLTGGLDPSESLPEVGFNEVNRKFLTAISKDYTGLLEQKRKLSNGKGRLELVAEERKEQLRLSATLADMAVKLATEATELEKMNDPKMRPRIATLQAQGTRYALEATRLRAFAMNDVMNVLREEHRKNTSGGTSGASMTNRPLDLQDPWSDLPEHLRVDPNSIDAMMTLVDFGVGSEFVTAMNDSWEKVSKISTHEILAGAKVFTAMEEAQQKSNTESIGVLVSQTEANLKLLDAAAKKATDPSETALIEMQKGAVIEQLKEQLRDRVANLTPRDTRVKAGLMGYIRGGIKPFTMIKDLRQIIMNPSTPSLDFTAESYEVLKAADIDRKSLSVPIYELSVKEVNRLIGMYADTQEPSTGGSGRMAKKLEDATRKQAWVAGQSVFPPPSSEEMHTWSLELGIMSVSATGQVEPIGGMAGFPSLKDARAIKLANKDKSGFVGNNVPLTATQFIMTPWYEQLMAEAAEMPEAEAIKHIQDTFDLFRSTIQGDIKFEDYTPPKDSPHPIPSTSPSLVVLRKTLLDTDKNTKVKAIKFMLLPGDTRAALLGNLREDLRDSKTSGVPFNQLQFLQDLHDGYTAQQSVFNYLESTEVIGLTPNIAGFSARIVSNYRSFDNTEDMKKAAETDPNAQVSYMLREKLIPYVIANLKIPGWTPELAAQPHAVSNVTDYILSDIVTQAALLGYTEAEGFKIGKDMKVQLSDRVNRLLAGRNARYSAFDGGIVNSNAEVIQTIEGPKVHIRQEQVLGSTGIDFGPEHRPMLVGSSSQKTYDPKAPTEMQRKILSQVGPAVGDISADYALLADNPTAGLVRYGVLSNKLISKSRVTELGGSQALDALVATAVQDLPQDNYTIMAATAAVTEVLNSDPLTANRLVAAKAAEIRSALLKGGSQTYSLQTIERPYFDGKGTKAPTLVVYAGDKPAAIFQPNEASYTMYKTGENPVIREFGINISNAQAHELLFKSDIPEKSKDALAIEILIRPDVKDNGSFSDGKVTYTKRRDPDSGIMHIEKQTGDPTWEQGFWKKQKTVGPLTRRKIYQERLETRMPSPARDYGTLNKWALNPSDNERWGHVTKSVQTMLNDNKDELDVEQSVKGVTFRSKFQKTVENGKTRITHSVDGSTPELVYEADLAETMDPEIAKGWEAVRELVLTEAPFLAAARDNRTTAPMSPAVELPRIPLNAVGTKPTQQFFDLTKALGRDIPPFFVDVPKVPEPMEQHTYPRPKSFNNRFDLWKSLWRDVPPFFVDEDKPSFEVKVGGEKLQPNPKYFDLWKALWRDFPPLFVPDPENERLLPNPNYSEFWDQMGKKHREMFAQ